MIARQWRGATRTADRVPYLQFLESTGLREYRETPGNRGALVLTREVAGDTEFLLLSFWESMEAVGRFAGPNPERAVFYPEDDRFLVSRGPEVQHFEVEVDEHETRRKPPVRGTAITRASRFLLMRE